MFDLNQLRINSIQRHLQILDMLLESNKFWIRNESRPEIAKPHEKIIDLIGQLRNDYIAILELYANDNR